MSRSRIRSTDLVEVAKRKTWRGNRQDAESFLEQAEHGLIVSEIRALQLVDNFQQVLLYVFLLE